MTKSLEDVEKFIKIAEYMLNKNEIDTSINRLYIATENTASIILEKLSIQSPKRHDKISNAIQDLFKKGKIDKDFSNLMKRLYELHLLSDYGKEPNKKPTKQEIIDMLEETKTFIEMAKKIIKDKDTN